MKKRLFGFALLGFSGLVAAISLDLAFIASETPMSDDLYRWVSGASHLTWYAAIGVQLIGAWITWRGLPLPRSARYVVTIVACDVSAFLISLWLLLDAHWLWTVARSSA